VAIYSSFEQSLYNINVRNSPQKVVVVNGLCELACTWVTNEDRLHYVFDFSKYEDEFIKKILMA